MKTLSSASDSQDILERLDKLEPTSKALWGKMNVEQMLAHCSAGIKMAKGEIKPKRALAGIILGKLFKKIYTNEKPLGKDSPTDKSLIFSGTLGFEKEREQLREQIKSFQSVGEKGCTDHPHPFFGKLEPQEWSRGMFKHLDHHFRQFGA
jgi:hypothetical protein